MFQGRLDPWSLLRDPGYLLGVKRYAQGRTLKSEEKGSHGGSLKVRRKALQQLVAGWERLTPALPKHRIAQAPGAH